MDPVHKLLAIEEIKQIKHRYWRILDQFLSDEIGEVFSENAVCDFGPYGKLEGRENIAEFFREKVFLDYEMAVHAGHNAEIELTTETTAKAHWLYEVYQLYTNPKTGIWLTGYMNDEYVLEDGAWKISYLFGEYYFNTNMEKLWHVERFSKYPPE